MLVMCMLTLFFRQSIISIFLTLQAADLVHYFIIVHNCRAVD